MKKLLYMTSLLALTFTSCDPMEDVYDEIDEANAEKLAEEKFLSDKTLIEDGYTLTDADFELSSNENVKKYKNFSASNTAADNLPEILTNKKLYGETGVEYSVSYKYYRGSLSYLRDYQDYLDELALLESYELTTDDYDSMGEESGQPGKYNNFSNSTPAADYLPAFLSEKYPDAENGFSVYVTYKFYDGSVSTVNEFWTYDGTTWAVDTEKELPDVPEVPSDVDIYELTSDDYDSMGAPGKYNNFSSSESPNHYLPIFLGVKFPYAKAGDKMAIVYKYYVGGGVTETQVSKEYNFDGQTWTEYQSTIIASSLVAFKEKVWVFVPPIKFVKTDKVATVEYKLTDTDYELTGDGKYDNFYIKNMTPEQVDAEIIPKITKMLKANFELAVGDVYEVTYSYYDGTNGEAKIKLEAVEDK